MRRLSIVAPSARVLLASVAVGATLAACTPAERAPDSARAAVDSNAATPSPSPAPSTAAAPTAIGAAAAPLPGALTKPIDQYTGDELYDLVRRLQWGGGVERERNCKGNPACGGAQPSRRTRVRVDAVNGQDSVSAIDVPTNGVLGMRALNRGTEVEDRYGFRPERRLEYYLIVLPGNATNGTWRLEELDTTPGARRHVSVGSGTFTPCNHPFRPNRVNRANFFTCADSHMSDSVQRSGLLLAYPKDPLWMSCAQGCCMAG